MGYYSELVYEINNAICDHKKLKEIEQFFSNTENEEVYGFCDVKFETLSCEKETGNRDVVILENIVLDDMTAKFYDDELFAEKLSKCIISGSVDLYFYGGEVGMWKYRASENKCQSYSTYFLTPEEHKKCKKILEQEFHCEYTRNEFMNFFRNEEKLNQLTPDDRIEIFSQILMGSSDFSKELLTKVLSDYGVTNIEVKQL